MPYSSAENQSVTIFLDFGKGALVGINDYFSLSTFNCIIFLNQSDTDKLNDQIQLLQNELRQQKVGDDEWHRLVAEYHDRIGQLENELRLEVRKHSMFLSKNKKIFIII